MFKTIKEASSAEVVEKKSKFIANIFYVDSVEMAEEIIKQVKKKYYDARHNCFAFSIMTQSGAITRFSDDGEPSGTAGAPMLNIIEKNNLSNVLIIVTRYFGGILLGTGGLVRAYSEATFKVIDKVQLVEEEFGMVFMVIIEYSNLERFKYYCKNNNINIVNIEFNDIIRCFVEVNEEEKNSIISNNELDIKDYKIIENKNIMR